MAILLVGERILIGRVDGESTFLNPSGTRRHELDELWEPLKGATS